MYPDEAQAEADALKNAKAAQQSAVSNQNGNAPPNDTESKEDPNDANASNSAQEPKPKKKIQKKKNRCWICRKKMTLAGQFTCKCGYTFCGQHRYPDSHNCDIIDIKKKHQENLAKANQVVAFKKVEEI